MACSSGNTGTVTATADGNNVVSFTPATDGYPFEDTGGGTWSASDWWVAEVHVGSSSISVGRTAPSAQKQPSYVTSVTFTQSASGGTTRYDVDFVIDLDLVPSNVTGILFGVAATSSSDGAENTGQFCFDPVTASFDSSTRADLFFTADREAYIGKIGSLQAHAFKVGDSNTGLIGTAAQHSQFQVAARVIWAGWGTSTNTLRSYRITLPGDSLQIKSNELMYFAKPDVAENKIHATRNIGATERITTFDLAGAEIATLTSTPSGNIAGCVQAGSDGNVFWSDDGNDTSSGVDNIHRVTTAGAVTTKFGSVLNNGLIQCSHYHTSNGLVYFSEFAGTRIKSWSPSVGGNSTTLLTAGSNIKGMCVDETNGYIYYAAGNVIYRCSLTGSGNTAVDSTWAGGEDVGGLAWLEPDTITRTEGTQLYGIYNNDPHSIGDEQKEGEGPFAMDVNEPAVGLLTLLRGDDYHNIGGMAYDSSGRIYYAGYLDSDTNAYGRIWRTDSEGDNLTTLLTSTIASNVAQWCLMDLYNEKIVYVFDNSLGSVNQDGTSDTVHTAALGDDVEQVMWAINGTHCYLVRSDQTVDYCLLATFAVVRTLAAGDFDNMNAATAIDVDAAGNVYIFGEDGTGIFYEIWNSDLTSRSSSITLDAAAGAVSGRCGFALDETNSKVYYSKDGSGIRMNALDGLSEVDFVAKSTRPHFLRVKPVSGSVATAL
jgi:hypothetical protein